MTVESALRDATHKMEQAVVHLRVATTRWLGPVVAAGLPKRMPLRYSLAKYEFPA